MLQDAGGGDVENAAVHQNAGVEQDGVIALRLAFEFDEGNDESEIGARLKDEADAEVGADQDEDEVNEKLEHGAIVKGQCLGKNLEVLGEQELDEEAKGVGDEQADEEPEERAGEDLEL